MTNWQPVLNGISLFILNSYSGVVLMANRNFFTCDMRIAQCQIQFQIQVQDQRNINLNNRVGGGWLSS